MSEASPLLQAGSPSPEPNGVAAELNTQVPRFPLLILDFILASKLDDVPALRLLNLSILQQLSGESSNLTGKENTETSDSEKTGNKSSFEAPKFPKLRDLEDCDGWTPLHSACESQSFGAASYLLSEGCSPNRPAGDRYSNVTPMHVACFGGNAQLVDVLISAGGMLLAPAIRNGLMPIDLASYTKAPSKDLVDIIDKHAGMKISFEVGDVGDLQCGPVLKNTSFHSLVRVGTQAYRIASEREIQESVFIQGSFGGPVRYASCVADAAKAIVDSAKSPNAPVCSKRDEPTSASDKSEKSTPIDPVSPNAGLSDSFSELMASREKYMSTAQHAANILESDTLVDKENTPQGGSNASRTWPMRAHTPLKKTPVEPANPDLFPMKKTARPMPKTKHARFAPGVQSPVSTRANGRRVHLGHPVSSLRQPLSDITPPQVSTPTAKASSSTKPPTPFPRFGKEALAMKADSLHFSSSSADEKENRHSKSSKVDFLTKTRAKKFGFKRVAFQDQNTEQC